MAEQALPGVATPADRTVADAPTGVQRATPYAYYALLLILLANFFNYVDRSVVSIVGARLQADLQLSDAQLGFLMGTAFAVFYGVVGLAMGRISDAVSRTRLMALGLAVWSGMTAAAGTASGYVSLASARMGVGIGEAVANPCAHSLLSDYFPQRNRSVVMGVYMLGVYLGGAASLIIGGQVLQHWSTLCTTLPFDACRLTDWRAVFLLVGLPGVPLALLLASLREPARQTPPRKIGLLPLVATEISAALPPFTLINLYLAGGVRPVVRNLVFAAALALGAWALTALIGDPFQWAAVALGAYSVVTWGAVLRLRDPPLHALTFGCPTFLFAMTGGALLACLSGAMSGWGAPYVMRVLHANPAEAGLALGVTGAMSSSFGVLVGSYITDIWKRHDRRAPIWICLISLFGPIPAMVVALHAPDLQGYVAAYAVFNVLVMMWSATLAALVQDLVMQRMRGTAAAALSLVMILIGSGVGPYMVGKVSTMTGSLTTGIYSILAVVPISAVLLLLAARRLPGETMDARRARAAAAGEVL